MSNRRQARQNDMKDIVILFLALSAAMVVAEPLQLQPGVSLVVDPAEPGPVLRAVEDLQRDLNWVMGVPSLRLDRLPADSSQPVIEIIRGGVGTEAHSIVVRGNRVVLQGTDVRGTIYAIYSFSDRFLDVPPWWFWAEWKPSRRGTIEVARDTNLHWASPQVAWRAWFPNDMDLLTPWIQKDYAAHWNMLVETMLRLKLNMIDIGELNELGMRKVAVPRERGLALTTTHMAPLGASFRNWGKFWAARGQSPAPELTVTNVAALEQFWEAHIRLVLREKVEMLWMIGFRGDGDKGFYKTFRDAPADTAGRARIVGDMMRRQVALLKRITGNEHPLMRAVFYDECSDYLAAGLLKPPEESSLIWNFVNARRDHFPAADVRQLCVPPGHLLGYYFNAQFTETGSHLADGEGPWKMEQNYRLVRQSGSNLVFSVINSGNTREFPLTLSAHAQMMWSFDAYESDTFVETFCSRYWGATYGPQMARLYRDYFAAYWQQRRPDLPGFERQFIFQDLRLARVARELMRGPTDGKPLLDDRDIGYYRIVPADNNTATRTDAIIAGCSTAEQQFKAVAERCATLAPRLPEQSRSFFEQSLWQQASFMAAASRCAVASAQASKVASDPESYRRWMLDAKTAVNDMEALLAKPNGERFAGWYAPEQIFKLQETQAMIDRRLKGFIPKTATKDP
jgi:hypothetical protein